MAEKMFIDALKKHSKKIQPIKTSSQIRWLEQSERKTEFVEAGKGSS